MQRPRLRSMRQDCRNRGPQTPRLSVSPAARTGTAAPERSTPRCPAHRRAGPGAAVSRPLHPTDADLQHSRNSCESNDTGRGGAPGGAWGQISFAKVSSGARASWALPPAARPQTPGHRFCRSARTSLARRASGQLVSSAHDPLLHGAARARRDRDVDAGWRPRNPAARGTHVVARCPKSASVRGGQPHASRRLLERARPSRSYPSPRRVSCGRAGATPVNTERRRDAPAASVGSTRSS